MIHRAVANASIMRDMNVRNGITSISRRTIDTYTQSCDVCVHLLVSIHSVQSRFAKTRFAETLTLTLTLTLIWANWVLRIGFRRIGKTPFILARRITPVCVSKRMSRSSITLVLSGSRDVIGHVTIQCPTDHFLFASSDSKSGRGAV